LRKSMSNLPLNMALKRDTQKAVHEGSHTLGDIAKNPIKTKRLTLGDNQIARSLFHMMTEVFDEANEALSDGYLDCLLRREDFWAIAAFANGEIVGGLTAHTMPMTRKETSEVFIYDIAVKASYQRKGVGRHLVTALREAAASKNIQAILVGADNVDDYAVDFYRALGGIPSPVTFFTFTNNA
jgi:aminoglycoside 3-N-acetyltransferase I